MPVDPEVYSDDKIISEAETIFKLWNDPNAFFLKVKNASPDILAAVMVRLSSTGEVGEKMKAQRDTCSAILHTKLNEQLISSNERLANSGKMLKVAAKVLAYVISIAGIIVSLFQFYILKFLKTKFGF